MTANADAPAPGKTVARYGLWQSARAPAEALAQPSAPMAPFMYAGALHFLQSLAEDDGRIALMRKAPDGGAAMCLTPPAFNIRTRVHEYGGRCFCVLGDQFVFNNLTDGRIYRQDLSAAGGAENPAAGAPQAVTEAAAGRHFADLTPLPRLQAVIAVMEVFDGGGDGGGHSRDALVLVDLAGEAAARGAGRPLVLVEGGDFYAAPALSPDQSQLAWLEWERPFMPWDQSRLVKARLPGAPRKIAAADREVVAAGHGLAVCQPGFLDDHNLLFAADRDADLDRGVEFWDFFRHIDHSRDHDGDGDGDHHRGGEIRRVTADRYEYGEAHWVFGARRWRQLSENTIAAVATAADGDRLLEVMLDSGDTVPLADDLAVCGDLAADGDALLWVARHKDRGAEIHKLDLKSGAREVLHRAGADDGGAAPAAPAAPSRAQPLIYPTRDGAEAHAIFYPPANPNYRAPGDALPPLLVMVHGGPTARATAELHPLKQYFASLGYALLDVNHRGSTGYGRAYRQALLGRWGEVDADDIADGIAFLADEGRIDPGLVFIRGGSAGGYAVLRALTRFPEVFSAGACYYGIGNLITLAQSTHRFEADYTDRLIGEAFDPAVAAAVAAGDGSASMSRFVQRSPLFHIERIACPLILFQGAEDKIVPPAVSREVAAALKAKGIAHEYVEYENEGHGFRQLATRVDSLEKETAFFARVIREKGGDGDGDAGDRESR